MLSHIVIDVVVVVGRELRRRCHPGLARRPAALGVARRCRALGTSATPVSRSAATSTFGLAERAGAARTFESTSPPFPFSISTSPSPSSAFFATFAVTLLACGLRRRPLALANFLEPISQADPSQDHYDSWCLHVVQLARLEGLLLLFRPWACLGHRAVRSDHLRPMLRLLQNPCV